MNYWKLLVLLLFISTFLMYIFLRSDLIGADNYNSYLKTCGKELGIYPPISEWIFNHIPCNILIFKLFSFLLFGFWLIPLYFLIKQYYPDNPWKVIFLIVLSIGLFGFFFEIEDDNIGYPILLASMVFFLKGEKNQDNLLKGVGIALVAFTGLFVWRGALIYLFAYSFFSPLALGLFLIVLSVFGLLRIFGSLFPALDPLNGLLWENTLFYGFATIPLYLPSFFVHRKNFYKFFVIFVFLMIFQARAVFHLIPFLLILMMDFLIEAKSFIIKHSPIQTNLNILIPMMALSLSFIFLTNMYSTIIYAPPSNQVLHLIDEGIQYSKDYNLPFKNEWSFGYWMIFKGIDTNFYGGWRPNLDLNHSIALSLNPKLDCIILDQNVDSAFPKGIFLYYCP